jgi:hypothetical protein
METVGEKNQEAPASRVAPCKSPDEGSAKSPRRVARNAQVLARKIEIFHLRQQDEDPHVAGILSALCINAVVRPFISNRPVKFDYKKRCVKVLRGRAAFLRPVTSR